MKAIDLKWRCASLTGRVRSGSRAAALQSHGRNADGTRHPPPPFLVSVHSKVFSLFRKFIRINTCGQFLEVLILRDLRSDKTRQNTAKRGVLVDDENKGVAEL